ncbi:MAG: signal recognition particle-docking protein FtsY [Polyangiales bacterium]
MVTALAIIAAICFAGALLLFLARKPKAQLPTARGPEAPEHAPAKSGAEAAAAQKATARAEPAAKVEAPDAKAAEPAERAREVGAAKVAPETQATTAQVPQAEQDIAAMRQGLASTRGGFVARLAKLFSGKKEIDKALLDEIEEVLISADLGVRTTERILEDLRGRMQRGELRDEQSVWSSIRAQAADILNVPATPLRLDAKPAVVLMIGVNGVGKTTTIGKLASRYTTQGKRVLLAAGDTYRAAAVIQLEMWGKRVGCPVVKGKENADPSSVIFEALKRGRDEGYDVVIADTAGRLHTKAPLMEELKKVERTVVKAMDGRNPDEVFLVLDSTTGQNAVQQVKLFRDAMTVTGLVLTKLDGTAKGGVILGIVDQHKIPVRYIGLGERVEDLREFEPSTFVEALFAKPSEATLAA